MRLAVMGDLPNGQTDVPPLKPRVGPVQGSVLTRRDIALTHSNSEVSHYVDHLLHLDYE